MPSPQSATLDLILKLCKPAGPPAKKEDPTVFFFFYKTPPLQQPPTSPPSPTTITTTTPPTPPLHFDVLSHAPRLKKVCTSCFLSVTRPHCATDRYLSQEKQEIGLCLLAGATVGFSETSAERHTRSTKTSAAMTRWENMRLLSPYITVCVHACVCFFHTSKFQSGLIERAHRLWSGLRNQRVRRRPFATRDSAFTSTS